MTFSRPFCIVVLVILCACFAGLASAQEEVDDLVLPKADEPVPQDPDEPLLPEVLVQPDEPAFTPVEVRPGGRYNLPGSYPNLSQQLFEGPSSATRGTESVFDLSQAGTIVTPQDLKERQLRSMVNAIQREVGIMVQSTGAGQASPFIRGLTGPQTLILIDGIRLNNSTFRFGPNQYFATIDPGMIDHVEIVRGPQSVLWGSDAIGGVINVVTRKADPRFFQWLGGEWISRYATADNGVYTRVSASQSGNGLGVFGGASYGNFNNLYGGGSIGVQPFTNYGQYAGDIRFDYLLDDNQLLTFAVQHFVEMYVPRTDKWPAEARRFDPQQRDLAYIRWQGYDLNGPFDAVEFTASYSFQKEHTKRRKPPTSPILRQAEFDVDTVGANLLGTRDLGWLGRITTGVDYYQDSVDAWNDSGDPQFPPGSYYERLGAFLQWKTDVTQRLAVTSGVRYTNIDAASDVTTVTVNPAPPPDLIFNPPMQIYPNFQDWTAMVGINYKVNRYVRFVTSVSEGFRAPNLDELTSISDNVNEGLDIPNPNLNPETAIAYEVGFKVNYPRLRAQTYYFWTDLSDLIDRVEVGSVPNPTPPPTNILILQQQNVGNAQINGYELSGEYLLTTTWSIFGNYTYLLGQNYTDAEPMSRIPPQQGMIGLRWRDHDMHDYFDIYGWMAARQTRLSARDRRDSRIPSGGTPGFGIVNINYGKQLCDGHLLTVGIENIFNEPYRVHGSGVDGPGISGHFGYQIVR